MSLLFFFRRSGPVAASEADSYHALGSHSTDFPLYLVEVAFDTDPTAADQTWTDVSDYVRAMSIRRGRDHELQRAETGTLSVLLDNRDRRFDPTYTDGPYYPNVLPMRQIRVRAYWDGTVYDLYRGFVEQWPQAWPEYGKDAVVEVTAFDALGALQLADARRAYADLIISHEPVGYWRLGEVAGTTAIDASGNGNDGTHIGGVTLGSAGLLAGDANPAATFGLNDLVSVPDDATLDFGDTFTVEAWVKPAEIGGSSEFGIVSKGNNDTGTDPYWAVFIDDGTGDLALVSFNTTDGFNTIAQTGSPLVNDTTYHVAVVKSGATTTIYIDGEDDTEAGINQTIPSNNAPLSIGNLYARTNGFRGVVDEVAVYDRALTAAEVAAHYRAGSATRPAETAAERVGFYLDRGGWPSGLRDLDTGQTTLSAGAAHDGGVSDAIQSIAEGERGLVFANPGGTVVFQDRHWRVLNAATAGAVLGDGGGSEVPVGDIVAGYDVQDVWNHVVVTPSGGTAVTASDATSQASYYRRSLELSLLTSDANEAQSAADYMLARYKDPHLRVHSVTLVGGSGTAIWPHALGGDISSRWTIRRRPPAGGTIEADVHLEAIQHDIQPGPVWVTSWSLSPADPQQYWVLEDAVLGVLDSTTRLAY